VELGFQALDLIPQLDFEFWLHVVLVQNLSEVLDSHLDSLLQLSDQFLDHSLWLLLSLDGSPAVGLDELSESWESLLEFEKAAFQILQLVQENLALLLLNEVLNLIRHIQEANALTQLGEHLLNVDTLDWCFGLLNVVQLVFQAVLKLLQVLDELSVPLLTNESHLLECLLDRLDLQLTLELNNLLFQLLDLLLVEETLGQESRLLLLVAQDGLESWQISLSSDWVAIDLLLQLFALNLVDLIFDFIDHLDQVLLGLSHDLLLVSLLLNKVVLQISQEVLQLSLSLLAVLTVEGDTEFTDDLLLEVVQLLLELLVMTAHKLVFVLLVLLQLLFALTEFLVHLLENSLFLLVFQVKSLSQQTLESDNLVFLLSLLLLGLLSVVSDGLQLVGEFTDLLLQVLLIELDLLVVVLLLLFQLTKARLDLSQDHDLLAVSVLLLLLLLLNQFTLNLLVQLLFPVLSELNGFPVQWLVVWLWQLLFQVLETQLQVLQALLQLLQTLVQALSRVGWHFPWLLDASLGDKVLLLNTLDSSVWTPVMPVGTPHC